MRRKKRRLKRPQRRRRRLLKRKILNLLKVPPQRLFRPRSSPSPLLQLRILCQTMGMTTTKMSPQLPVQAAGSASTNRLLFLQAPPLTLPCDLHVLRVVAMTLGVPTIPKYETPSLMIRHFPNISLPGPLQKFPLRIHWRKHPWRYLTLRLSMHAFNSTSFICT